MALKELNLVNIRYTKTSKDGDEVTNRTIIPTYVPNGRSVNVGAIDVTDLSETEREEVLNLYKDFSRYRESIEKTVFNFDNFVEHTTNEKAPKLNWKSFNPNKIEILD